MHTFTQVECISFKLLRVLKVLQESKMMANITKELDEPGVALLCVGACKGVTTVGACCMHALCFMHFPA